MKHSSSSRRQSHVAILFHTITVIFISLFTSLFVVLHHLSFVFINSQHIQNLTKYNTSSNSFSASANNIISKALKHYPLSKNCNSCLKKSPELCIAPSVYKLMTSDDSVVFHLIHTKIHFIFILYKNEIHILAILNLELKLTPFTSLTELRVGRVTLNILAVWQKYNNVSGRHYTKLSLLFPHEEARWVILLFCCVL